jgi:hypothetical protein
LAIRSIRVQKGAIRAPSAQKKGARRCGEAISRENGRQGNARAPRLKAVLQKHWHFLGLRDQSRRLALSRIVGFDRLLDSLLQAWRIKVGTPSAASGVLCKRN